MEESHSESSQGETFSSSGFRHPQFLNIRKTQLPSCTLQNGNFHSSHELELHPYYRTIIIIKNKTNKNSQTNKKHKDQKKPQNYL